MIQNKQKRNKITLKKLILMALVLEEFIDEKFNALPPVVGGAILLLIVYGSLFLIMMFVAWLGGQSIW